MTPLSARISKAARLSIVALAFPAFAAGAQPIPSFMPLRAPDLAAHCANSDVEILGERARAFCAGYVRAVLELDPEIQRIAARCAPLPAAVLDEIIRRARDGTAGDRAVVARDLIVRVVLAICEADVG